MEYFTLNDGNKMPAASFGTLHSKDYKLPERIFEAIKAGYRCIDAAQSYFNEENVGKGIKQALDEGIVRREDLFIVSKLSSHRVNYYEKTIEYVNDSLEKLGVDYLDLFLIHLPRVTPDDSWKDLNKETWRALEYLVEQGKIKSIGVSNFMIHHLDALLQTAKIKPAVNQLEFSPQWQQKEVMNYCKSHNIALNGFYITGNGNFLDKEELVELEKKYKKTKRQILSRYCIDKGVIPITRTSKVERMRENLDIFNFKLTNEDILLLDGFNSHPASAKVGLPDNKYETWLKIDSDLKEKINYSKKYKLFNLITLFKWKYINPNKSKFYLFNFLLVCTIKDVDENKSVVKIFGLLPLFKIKKYFKIIEKSGFRLAPIYEKQN
jgi:diketogulonate reductase-like aldo/keto reductase